MKDSFIISVVSMVVILMAMFMEKNGGTLDNEIGHFSIIAAFVCILAGIVLRMYNLMKNEEKWYKLSFMFWLLVDGSMLLFECIGKIAYTYFRFG